MREKVGVIAQGDAVADDGEDGREEWTLHEVHERGMDHGEVETNVSRDVGLCAFVVEEWYHLE